MTARPNGAFCSPPSPSPSAMGTMPIIMASAVISHRAKTGKSCFQRGPKGIHSFRHFFRGKLTTKMLLEVATPMHMMAPMSAAHSESCAL